MEPTSYSRGGEWTGRAGSMRRQDERGVSGFLVMALVLIVIVVGMVLVRRSMGPSSGSIGPDTTVVAAADAAQAQQSLATARSTVQSQLAAAAATGSVSPSALHAAEPSVTFTLGASTGPTTVSVFADAGGTGAVNLAARSSDGTCWYLWWSSSQGTWYGAQTNQTACAALSLLVPPSPAAVTDASIGWQQSSFPSA